MTLILIIFCIWGASALIRASKEVKAERERERLRREQAARSAELARLSAEWKQRQAEAKLETAKLIALEREQMRQAREQEKLAKEQEKQAEVLRKHEERLMKLEQRMATAESELAFNREQRDRLFKLLDIEERERDAAIEGSATWQKHQKKVISLENQIHTVQKRIDKAHMDKAFCEKQMEVA
jgi:hypothetical protein